MDPREFGSRRVRRRGVKGALLLSRLGLAALVVLAALLVTVGVQFYTEWLWFESLGFSGVYLTMLSAQAALFVAGSLVFFALFALNVSLARRLAFGHRHLTTGEDEGIWAYVARVGARVAEPNASTQFINRGILGLGGLLALIMGLVASGQWDTILRFQNAVPFGSADPIFGQDIGFYVFSLPILRFAHSWLLGALILIGTAGVATYAIVLVYELGINLERAAAQLQLGAKLHLAVLGAGLMLLMAANHALDLFELLYSSRGVAFGASYTDVNAQAPALVVMAVTATIAALLILASAWFTGFRLPVLGLGVWAVVALLGGLLYPNVVQTFQVKPNELDRERPFIEHSIRMTRQAYGLADVEERFYPAEDSVTSDDIVTNPETIENIRLWDHRPLRDTLNQIQSIRTYYGFNDVDVDRYVINGRYRQVMIGARELAPEQLQAQARTWVNQRLQFTHGYGVTMSLVSAVAEEGRPQLVVQDVPPRGDLKIDRPELYYGERTAGYVIVNTDTPEFDYPKGDENVFSRYQGTGGVNIGSPLNRLALALRFQDANILLSDALTPDSRLEFRRQVTERVREIAPFLLLDRDPYIVLADGNLYWIQDAYTYSNGYPYSEPRLWARGLAFNYIRNSVKVTINAYDGSVNFYVADPEDPILRTYSRIFPGMFQPLSAMPESLRGHLRYPEDLFSIQANVFETYHMQDANVFYNKEDVWSVPFERFYGEQRPVDPYYVIMRLPGEEKPEFLLMQPFTPRNKDNMIAWLAGRADDPNYGRLLLFKYPKEKLVYGPFQVESRIDQDPTISAQFSLWNQVGSQVIRGNLLVIPLGNSNLYVEPIFLQAEGGAIPELKRVILSTGNRVVMEPTLELALEKLFAGGPDGTAQAQPPPERTQEAPQPPREDVQAGQAPQAAGDAAPIAALAKSAQEHYEAARAALREGDWGRYGEELKAMEADLRRLVELTGSSQP